MKKLTPTQQKALDKMGPTEWACAKDLGVREATMKALARKGAIKFMANRNSDGVPFYLKETYK